jgi:hypothetical protein
VSDERNRIDSENQDSAIEDDPSPYQVTTKYNVVIDTRESIWRLDGRESTNVGTLRDMVHPVLREGLNGTLRSWAALKSVGTIRSLASAIFHYRDTMHRDQFIDQWTKAQFINYRNKLNKQFASDTYLVAIRSFLKHWFALRLPGIDQNAVDALNEMSLKVPKPGQRVTSMDPQEGPFTTEEQRTLRFDLFNASEAGKLSLEDLSLVTFHIVTGRRPIQTTHLKCMDVDRNRKSDVETNEPGRSSLIIAVPRAKKKGKGFRESLRGVHADEPFFALMEAQKNSVQAKFLSLLCDSGFDLQSHDKEHLLQNLPLYPHWDVVKQSLAEAAQMRSNGAYGDAIQSLRVLAPLPMWHSASKHMTYRLGRTVKAIGTKSRTGQSLNITAYRFRYTRGTELARQGVALEVIAWLLDHSTLESARVYIDSLVEDGAWINAALKDSNILRRVATAFTPELAESDDPDESQEDRRAAGIYYRGQKAARCGIRKQCGMGDGIPRACYTCNNFRPWLDGPHEKILQDLLQDRSEDAKILGENSPVTRRRDETIIAVIITIHRCQVRREELARQKEAA